MVRKYRTRWPVLAVLAGALGSRGGCAEEPPLGRPTPTVSPSPSLSSERVDTWTAGTIRSRVTGSNYYRAAVTQFYDSDKVVGIFPEHPGTGPNSFVEYQFLGEDLVRIEGHLNFGNETSLPIGTPFAFHCYSDWFGHLRGFERVRANPSPVYFVIPVSASALGVEPLIMNYTGSPPGGHGLGVGTSEEVFIGDSNSFPTAALLAPSLPGIQNLVPSVHAVYLSGNDSHELVGEETFAYPQGLFFGGGNWILNWGYQDDPAPYVIYAPSHLPLGPTLLEFRLTGYTSDVATMELADLKARVWTPLLGSTFDTPGYPTPSEAAGIATLTAEEGDFIMEPAIRDKLLGQCELFTNLKHASDRNGDKLLDIADYRKLAVEREARRGPNGRYGK